MLEKNIRIEEFCDMEQLYALIDNWSSSTGMSAVIIDAEGRRTSESFGMTPFCSMIHQTEKGMELCGGTWKCDASGVYECPMGLYDTCIPLVLPDGTIIGKVNAGQAMTDEQDVNNIIDKARQLGLDDARISEELSKMKRKSREEMESAFSLLRKMLTFFIEKSYGLWKSQRDLEKAPDAQDRILSQITQIMYSYNLTVNVETGKYNLITGTGMERTVAEYKKQEDYSAVREFSISIVHPAYINKMFGMVDIERLRDNWRTGFIGTMEYPVLYPGDVKYEWHEINVFAAVNDMGVRIVNILGRDVTDIHDIQEKNDRELKAAAEKNQILSEITRMLYSYNLTLNLTNGKYSLIEGTGMTKFIEIFRSTDDYETAYNRKLAYIEPDYISRFVGICSLEALRGRKDTTGFIGSLEYGAITEHGEEWHEINVFIITNEMGEPMANILGRDITEAHKRQEQKELSQRAAMAKDQLLSGVTRMLYSFNVTVNLKTWKYTLIKGTGIENAVSLMEQADDYVLTYARLKNMLLPEYRDELDRLVGINALRSVSLTGGYIGSVTTAADFGDRISWQEINLFIGTNEYGEPIANILGRDITEMQEHQKAREMELKASVAKDQILSEITRTLYSYNITVSLQTGSFTLITGTGMKETVEHLKDTDDYMTAVGFEVSAMMPEYREKFLKLASLDMLRMKTDISGHIGQMEYAAKTERGIEWREVNIFLGVDEDGNHVANILGRDITEAHDKADTLAQLEIAQRANEAKSLFLSNMSHDIRTPMNGIIGMTAIANTHIDDKERVKDCLGKISVASRHLLSLINDILDLSKIESGSIALSEESFSISELLDNMVNMLSPQMRSKGQQFRFHIDRVTHEKVIGDAVKLQQVFTNILSNAIKYTPDGGSISVEFNEKPADSSRVAEYEFICTDNGYGMSEEYLKKLFEPFERAQDERIKNIQGTGLGMVITRNIVRMMDGDIAVESELDKGSRFTVNFRMKLQEDDELYNDKLAQLKMLIADEDISICESASMAAKELGIAADYVLSGEDAVKTAAEHLAAGDNYNVCLLDCKLPITNEINVIRQLRSAAGRDLKIIIISTYDWTDIEAEARRAGADAFISKPLFKSKIFEKLREVVLGEEQERAKPDELSKYSERDFSDKRILLVEDNELNREIACAILRETKVSVETAENGKAALEMIEKSSEGYYDMVLMDIQMPVMDGLEATHAIRQLGRYDVKVMPIVAMSANAFSEDISKSKNAGMNDHIPKPINLKKLLSIMEYYLGDHTVGAVKKNETPSYKTNVMPAKYYEELYFTDGTTELSAENEQACIDVLERNGAVGIFGMLEEPDLPIYCVSGFALNALGYTYEELMKVSKGCFINLVYPEDRDKVTKQFYNRGHKQSYRIICKNGEIINVVAYTSDTYIFDDKKVRMTSVKVIAI